MSNITGRLMNAVRLDYPGGFSLSGEIYEDIHGRFDDGKRITTSAVVHHEGSVYSTLNSIYEVENWQSTNTHKKG